VAVLSEPLQTLARDLRRLRTTHVARILQKLGLRDRVQVVIYADESGLLSRGAT